MAPDQDLARSSISQQKSQKRTKAMWNAGISAVNAFLETDEDYNSHSRKQEFLSCVRKILESAESMTEALREAIAYTDRRRTPEEDRLELEQYANLATDDLFPVDRIKDLEHDLVQEKMKRKRLEEDMQTHRVDATEVLAEVMRENDELRTALLERGEAYGGDAGALSAAGHSWTALNGSTGLKQTSPTKRKHNAADNSTFSWDTTLNNTIIIYPDGHTTSLSENPSLKAQVLQQVQYLTSDALDNRHTPLKGMWQCISSRKKGNAGVFRKGNGQPVEACTHCVAAGRLCLAFKCGVRPTHAETKLLPLPEGMRIAAMSREVGFFRQNLG